MPEEEFEWNESKLNALSEILTQWAPHDELKLENVILEAKMAWIHESTDAVALEKEFEKL